MAILLKYDLCVLNGCKTLRFTENTGVYSATNTTGYGSPNTTLAQVLTAILTVKGPDNITYTIDLFATGLFPSDSLNSSYDIPLSLIGNPPSIVDGEWYFIYTITTASLTFSTTIYKYFYCASECCVSNMLPLVTDCIECQTGGITFDTYNLAFRQLQALKNAAKCGDVNNFISIKKIIDKLCLNSGCKTCK